MPAAWRGLSIALGLVLILTPLMRRVALSWGIVDRPADRKIHRHPTPLLGGVALVAGVVTALLVGFPASFQVWGIILGALSFLLLGLADDLFDLGAIKLAAEFGIASLVVAATGIAFHIPWGIAGPILTVLWIVGVVNAFNCFDCADGVAASTGLAAAGAFLIIGVATGQQLESWFSSALLGASLGFLCYNLHPARIFLGDAGSLALGYLTAMMGVTLSPGMISTPALFAPAVVLAIPIYDILYVHIRRFRHGQRSLWGLLTSTGKDHLPHRLMGRGFSQRRMMWIVLLASAVTGGAGVALASTSSPPGIVAVAGAVVCVLVLLERGRPATGRRWQSVPKAWMAEP